MSVSVCDFGLDLWIELIISNDLSNQEILNLCVTCKFFLRLLTNEKVAQLIESRNRSILFGNYHATDLAISPSLVQPQSISWSHDNRNLASGDGSAQIILWDTKTGRPRTRHQTIGFSYPIYKFTFHPRNANLLAVSFAHESLCLWDIEKCKITINFDDSHALETIWCLAFHPQGKLLASGHLNGPVQIWNAETGKCEKMLICANSSQCTRVHQIDFSPDGKFLAASISNMGIFVWAVDAFVLLAHPFLTGNQDGFFKFFDNNTLIVTTFERELVKFYDFVRGVERTEMQFHSELNGHFRIALHPTQKLIFLAGKYGLEIWEIQSKKVLHRMSSPVRDLSLSPNGTALAAIFPFKTAKIQVLNIKNYL